MMRLPVFPMPLAEIIAGYVPAYEFLDWVALHVVAGSDDNPMWTGLAGNPNAIDILLGNMHMFGFSELSDNPNACELLMERPMQVDWFYASQHPGMTEWLNEHREYICWEGLAENPSEIARDLLIERGLDIVDWAGLCANPASWAVDIVLANPNRFSYWGISKNTNPRVIAVLKKNLEKSLMHYVYANPAAIHLINDLQSEQHTGKEYFTNLMSNPAAIDYIRAHILDSDFEDYTLWSNPAILRPVMLVGLVELLSGSTVYVSAS
jgi:hypothetical protein